MYPKVKTMKNDVLISIVTPTYNRGKLLEHCFASLLAQTDKRFEWVIVDDGSTDDTELRISGFRAQAPEMDIQYIKKENGGKHSALNASHPYLRGRYVLMLDSDDTLTKDAVALSLGTWAEWDGHPEVGFVTLLKGADPDHPNCYAADENVPVDPVSYPRIRVRSSDACEVIRTELFRKFPFPIFPGERFISEGVLWNRVGQTHKCVYVNRVIYLCDYLEGGLTKSGRAMRIRNPRGGMYSSNLNMCRKKARKIRIKAGLLYTCYGFFAKLSPRKMAASCDYKALMWLCLPGGWLLYRRWKKTYA